MRDVCRAAERFVWLVDRAVEEGVLRVDDLLTAYRALGPSGHGLADDPRRVDLGMCRTALEVLPAVAFGADELWLVGQVDGYGELVDHGVARVGGDAYALAVPGGRAAVLDLAVTLCGLHLEMSKAQALLSEAPWGSAAAEGDGVGEADADPRPEDLDTEQLRARLAFIWGIEPADLAAADLDTDGFILRLLTGVETLGRVKLHADLRQPAVDDVDGGDRLRLELAELGLGARRVVLWLGEGAVVDCLSPYTRELAPLLASWARHQTDLPDGVLQELDRPSEDALYLLAHLFVASHGGLAEERRAAEQTVGIRRHRCMGTELVSVDLGRVDPTVVDARLGDVVFGDAAPVLLWSPLFSDGAGGQMTAALVRALGPQLEHVVICSKGTLLDGRPGAAALGRLAVDWCGEHKLAGGRPAGFGWQDVAPLVDHLPQSVGILTTPSFALLNIAEVQRLRRDYGVDAVVRGQGETLRALVDASWSGQLAEGCAMTWAVVHDDGDELRVSRAAHGIAVAGLRTLVVEEPQPVAEPPAPVPPKPPMSRAWRIKA